MICRLKKPCLSGFLFILALTGFEVLADSKTLSCLQLPSRIAACPNLVYRAVKDVSTNKNKIFCFCKLDFDLLFNKDVSEKQAILNRMELKQILSETRLTELQLFKMVSR
jgi:hypothetical protein